MAVTGDAIGDRSIAPRTPSRLEHAQSNELGVGATRTVCPVHHQQGKHSCSHRTPHDHFMETNSAQIGCSHLDGDGSSPEVYCHRGTRLAELQSSPVQRHRTMRNRLPG